MRLEWSSRWICRQARLKEKEKHPGQQGGMKRKRGEETNGITMRTAIHPIRPEGDDGKARQAPAPKRGERRKPSPPQKKTSEITAGLIRGIIKAAIFTWAPDWWFVTCNRRPPPQPAGTLAWWRVMRERALADNGRMDVANMSGKVRHPTKTTAWAAETSKSFW